MDFDSPVFDVYCAICGVGFRGFQIGSSSPASLEHRDRSVNDESNPETTTEGGNQRDDNEENVVWGYDPRLVNQGTLEWLQHVHCLGYNRYATGKRKTFVIGPGEYLGDGELHILRGNDPNRPEDIEFGCYGDASSDGVIPFHWECFRVLSRRLTGTSKRSEIDTDLLYSVMIGMSAEYQTSLNQPYGEHVLKCQGKYWDCIPGTEYVTINPVRGGESIVEGMAKFWADRRFEFPQPCSERLGMLDRVRTDPFRKLPPEIVCEICEYLSYKEVKALSVASVHATIHTLHGSFWKRLIWRTMPWFWEYCDKYEQGSLPGNLPYKLIYLWLTTTVPQYGLESSFEMRLANRQRIWNACKNIAAAYRKTQRGLSRPGRENHRIKINSLRSETPRLTTVGHTRSPGPVRTVSEMWVHEWEDVYEHPGNFEIVLNSSQDIVGLTVGVGGERRTFGRSMNDGTVDEELSSYAAMIPKNDWIQGMILNIATQHRLTDPTAATALKGVTVLLKSGDRLELGDVHGECSVRRLSVSDKCVLLGLHGEIAEDHTILRLGLLECLDPKQDETYPEEERMANAPLQVQVLRRSADDIPFVDRLLWSTENAALYFDAEYEEVAPIWDLADVRVLPLLEPQSDEADLAPCHTIDWSNPNRELQSISAWVTEDSGLPGTDAQKPFANVLGMTARFRRRWEGGIHVGLNRRAAEERDSGFYDKLQHFEIDGRAGEYITEVGVAVDQSWSAIKLRTNRDREIVFGQQDASIDKMAKAAEGQVIAGLAIQFVNRPRPGFEKWMQLSSLAILTEAMDLEDTQSDGQDDST